MGSSWADCNQKNLHSEVLSSLAVCNNNKPFLNWMWCETKWTVYNNQQWPAQGLDQEEAPKHFPKPNLHQKRSWLLVVCCPPNALQLSESQRNHYIWDVCSANRCTDKCNNGSWYWSTESAQFFSKTTPDRTMHNQRFESWMNWAMKFCLICHSHLTSHQLTTTSSSVSTTFCRENASTTSMRQKMLSKSSSNPETDFYATEINLSLIGKNVMVVMVPILIN